MAARINLCVFCGSSIGADPEFRVAARIVGQTIAEAGFGLVYGGGQVGLMGVVADAVLEHGGSVIGVIPETLSAKEIAHQELTELHIVNGMHERKALMASRANGFLTLPGGIGTFEEFFEILTWSALGIHEKPMAVLNTRGYFNPMIALLEHGVSAGLVRPRNLESLLISDDPSGIVTDLFLKEVGIRPDQELPSRP